MNQSADNAGITEKDIPGSVSELPKRRPGEEGKARSDYIKRHWRGEMSLPWSFWINGFVCPAHNLTDGFDLLLSG